MILRYQPLTAPPRLAVRNGGQPWTPPADVAETEQEYVLALDLPGVAEQNIEVRFDDGLLNVEGERKGPSDGLTRRERRAGPFRRNFRLPEAINAEGITARFEGGVLEVHVPKTDRSRKIDIQ